MNDVKTVWRSMRNRCLNPKSRGYENYGGRGIKVCDRWLGSFDNFKNDMGERLSGMTLERINNDGDYEPSNCRWATRKEQQNNKRNNILMTLNGVTKNVMEWSEELGIGYTTLLLRRTRYGWTDAEILTTPVFAGGYNPSGRIRPKNPNSNRIKKRMYVYQVLCNDVFLSIGHPSKKLGDVVDFVNSSGAGCLSFGKIRLRMNRDLVYPFVSLTTGCQARVICSDHGDYPSGFVEFR